MIYKALGVLALAFFSQTAHSQVNMYITNDTEKKIRVKLEDKPFIDVKAEEGNWSPLKFPNISTKPAFIIDDGNNLYKIERDSAAKMLAPGDWVFWVSIDPKSKKWLTGITPVQR